MIPSLFLVALFALCLATISSIITLLQVRDEGDQTSWGRLLPRIIIIAFLSLLPPLILALAGLYSETTESLGKIITVIIYAEMVCSFLILFLPRRWVQIPLSRPDRLAIITPTLSLLPVFYISIISYVLIPDIVIPLFPDIDGSFKIFYFFCFNGHFYLLPLLILLYKSVALTRNERIVVGIALALNLLWMGAMDYYIGDTM